MENMIVKIKNQTKEDKVALVINARESSGKQTRSQSVLPCD